MMTNRTLSGGFLAFFCFVALALLSPALYADHGEGGSFGEVIPLPGAINELYVDEARGLIYAANFNAGRVEVVSMATRRRVGSFPTTPDSAATSGMAVSHDNQYLVTTNLPATVGVAQNGSVTVVNLNDTADRVTYAFPEWPLSVAFGANNIALIATQERLLLFNPRDGTFEIFLTYADIDLFGVDIINQVILPVPPPRFPDEVLETNLASSADGSYIFGLSDGFIFSYKVGNPRGLMVVRVTSALNMIRQPLVPQVSVADSGEYFMAGQMLMDRDLRIIADSPEAGGGLDGVVDPVGGTGIDSRTDTVYFAWDDRNLLGEEFEDEGHHPRRSILQIMDRHNLFTRRRIRLPERITGRIFPTGANRDILYAISDSGLLYIPLHEISQAPQLSVEGPSSNLYFGFDFCDRQPITQTLSLRSANGIPAQFSLSAEPLRSNNRVPILFEPHTGVTPVDVQVTVDPGGLGPVTGVTGFEVTVDTNAVNVPRGVHVIGNTRSVEQIGRFQKLDGLLVDILADPVRDRFYVLDQGTFQVHAFDSNTFRQIGSLPTGNTPTWMTITKDGRFLLVANSRGENVSMINLEAFQLMGYVFLPWQTFGESNYPESIAALNGTVVITSEGSTFPRMSTLDVRTRLVSLPDDLGIFDNLLTFDVAALSSWDGSSAFLISNFGNAYLWEAESRRLVITRDDFIPFGSGAAGVGAGPGYYVVNDKLLNESLVPIGEFPDDNQSQQMAGFAVLPDGTGVRSVRPTIQVDTGSIHQLDQSNPRIIRNPVRLAEPPPPPSEAFSFHRTLAALRDGRLVSTSSAGIVEIPADYTSSISIPRISAITNGADFTANVGTGGLVSIFGENLSAETAQANGTPLPTNLASTCVSANGATLPLMFVSPTQINAQMPFAVNGSANIIVSTQGGRSDSVVTDVLSTAPAVFGVPGPNNQRFAAIVNTRNNAVATNSNPVKPNEVIVIWATGLGGTTPASIEGFPASGNPLAVTAAITSVSIGGVASDVLYSGLTPGFVGLYQINVRVHPDVPRGFDVPVNVVVGGSAVTERVRIVE